MWLFMLCTNMNDMDMIIGSEAVAEEGGCDHMIATIH